MGRNLARLQIQMLFQQLLKRLPHLEMDPNQDFGRLPSVSFRGSTVCEGHLGSGEEPREGWPHL